MILSLITNNVVLAQEAEYCGIDRIMIDLERKGKDVRQSGKDLFLSDHTIEDLPKVKSVLRNAQLMVRVNSLHKDSKQEIETVLGYGADVVMLPYFHSEEEAAVFCSYVNGRAKTSLLVETKEAASRMSQLIQLQEVNEIHIGLNDLKISMNYKSIFEPIYNGRIEELCELLKASGKQYGFGGIGKLSRNDLPVSPERILAEQIRQGCTIGWLGRTFRIDKEKKEQPDQLKKELTLLQATILKWENASLSDFERNKNELHNEIKAWEEML
jgi:hypothetical protein